MLLRLQNEELTPGLGDPGRIDTQVMGLKDFGQELYHIRFVSHSCHYQI